MMSAPIFSPWYPVISHVPPFIHYLTRPQLLTRLSPLSGRSDIPSGLMVDIRKIDGPSEPPHSAVW
jgi:hypothetical protein